MRVRYDLEFEDLVAFGLHQQGPACRRLHQKTKLVLATLLAAVGIVVGALGAGIGWPIAGLLMAVLVLTLIGPKYGEAVTLAFMRKELEQFDDDAYLGERVLEIEDGVLSQRSGDSEYRVMVSALHGVQSTDTHTFIYSNPASAITVAHERVREGDLGVLVAALERATASPSS